MELQSIDHIQVAGPPGCEAAARSFYGDLLGLREIPKPSELAARGGVWFQLGTQELHVGVESEFRPALRAHPAFRCADPDSLARALAEAGAPVTWDEALPGVRRFYTSDPFGNRLEVMETPLSVAF
jgi:catechol 2,3-dioxygenase-like lactoylglutathione lyase family enzyme